MYKDGKAYNFVELYNDYYFWLYNSIKNYTNDPELSKDLVQQTYFSIYCSYFMTEERVYFFSPKSLLYKIAKRFFINQHRRNIAHDKMLENFIFYQQELFVLNNQKLSLELMDKVQELLDGNIKTTFLMYFYYGFTYQEISSMLNHPIHKVRHNLSKGIKTIQRNVN